MDANGVRLSTDRYTFFGQRAGLTALTVALPAMRWYAAGGTVQSGVPAAATWAVTAHPLLYGYFADPAGNTYLRSTTGQLVTWSVTEGLQVHSTP